MRYNNHHFGDFSSHFVSCKEMVIIMNTGEIILAPMEGVLDYPLREAITDYNHYDYCVSEFISISDEPPEISRIRLKFALSDGITAVFPVLSILPPQRRVFPETGLISVLPAALALMICFKLKSSLFIPNSTYHYCQILTKFSFVQKTIEKSYRL